jgi:adenylate cyclase class 2
VNSEKRLEVEVKVRVASLPALRKKLLAMGAKKESPRALERNLVFDSPAGDLRGKGILLRLRRVAKRSILTMKTPAAGNPAYKVRRETEVGVSDFSGMEAILLGIGFRPVFIYEKFREVLALDGIRIMLDETPIGDFLEIEGRPGGIDAVAGRLGFCRGEYLTESYYRLFLLSGRSGHMVFTR